MNETSKSRPAMERNLALVLLSHCRILDIGAGDDPLRIESSTVDRWDRAQGDAATLLGVLAGSYDAVYSSHCLEHLPDVPAALTRWSDVVRPGGRLYIVVPSFRFYEYGAWPSMFAPEHRAAFDLVDPVTRPPCPFYGLRELRNIAVRAGAELCDARLELDNYDVQAVHVDQTRKGALAQCAFVFRKAPAE